jgi:F0F1-type ATP synthase assembly protein I
MAKADRVTIDQATVGKYDQAGISGDYNKNRFGQGRTQNVQVEARRQAVAEASLGAVPSSNVSVEAEGTEESDTTNATATVERRSDTFVARQYTKVKERSKQKKTTKTVLAQTRASAVNVGIMTWLVPSYIFVQLPFAVINITFFGIAAFTQNVIDSVSKAADGSIIAKTFVFVLSGIGGFLAKAFKVFSDGVKDLTGIDIAGIVDGMVEGLQVFAPTNMYMATLGFMLLYALLVLLSMGLLYKLNRINPLWGDGSMVKISAFLGCLIGYILPFFNLFPWAVFWAVAVWKNPK